MKTELTYPMLGKFGRFGNQLWQIAGTIGHAVNDGMDYAFPEWEYQSEFINPLPVMNGKPRIHVRGYLQDVRYWLHCQDLIHHHFQMKPRDVRLPENTVFIHFRAYSKERVTHLHPEQTTGYYEKAMQEFPDKQFLVFSDDIEKAKKIVPVKSNFFQDTKTNEMDDFWKMIHCDGAIISNSSFAWWAAYLGKEKPVVAPKNWYCGEYLKTMDTTGLYLQNWKVV